MTAHRAELLLKQDSKWVGLDDLLSDLEVPFYHLLTLAGAAGTVRITQHISLAVVDHSGAGIQLQLQRKRSAVSQNDLTACQKKD